MKKFLALATCFAAFSVNAQTADEIIQKYTANMGGLDSFNKVRTVKITANFNTQGFDLPMTIQVINNRASRTELEANGQNIIRVYKDGKGWTVNPLAGITSPREATATELSDYRAQSILATALMDYKARGHTVELLGEESVEGIKAWKIKLVNKDDGKATLYYINKADHVMIKSSSERQMQGKTTTVEVWYSDLKEFAGLKFFTTRTSKIDGEVFQTTSYSNVELNVAVDEKIFDMPK
jgi:hypothetical protein